MCVRKLLKTGKEPLKRIKGSSAWHPHRAWEGAGPHLFPRWKAPSSPGHWAVESEGLCLNSEWQLAPDWTSPWSQLTYLEYIYRNTKTTQFTTWLQLQWLVPNQKIIRHAKKQWNIPLERRNTSSTETNPKLTQMLELAMTFLKKLFKLYFVCSKS